MTALEARPEDDLILEFIKNKIMDECRHRCDSCNVASNSCDSTYKVVNKNTKGRKFWNFCKRGNHNRSECFYLKNKTPNNLHKNDPNRNKLNNNLNSFKNNSRNYRTNQSNSGNATNFCFESNANVAEDSNDSFPLPTQKKLLMSATSKIVTKMNHL